MFKENPCLQSLIKWTDCNAIKIRSMCQGFHVVYNLNLIFVKHKAMLKESPLPKTGKVDCNATET
jgi:hypothetical protein